MMVLTAKVDLKKILMLLVITAVIVLTLCVILGKQSGTPAPTSVSMSANDSRVKFLESFGWEVTPTPKESTQVKIPDETSELFRRYNTLQKGQGYDLSKYTGKKVMRYVYEIRNFPGGEEPVYATLLLYKNQIIGGDITDTAARGKVRGFQMPPASESTSPAGSTPPETPTQQP